MYSPKSFQPTLTLALTLALLPASLALPAVPSLAVPLQQAAPTGASLQKTAEALETAGKWNAAGAAYTKAADAFQKEGNTEAYTKALEKSATMYENYANALLKNLPPAPAPAQTAPAQPAAPDPAPVAPEAAPTAPAQAAPAAGGTAPLPLEKSAIVHKGAKGLAVTAAGGKPVDGVKLSRHDSEIDCPSMAVAPNGTIHVAFVEKMAQNPYTYSVYHRASSDGGKTWSAAKNLSEVMPGYNVGRCLVAADSAGRVYVAWRTGMKEGYNASGYTPHSNQSTDCLVCRVLENGAWSGKAFPVNPPATVQFQDEGATCFFMTTGGDGKVHVIWNQYPTAYQKSKHDAVMGHGTIMESVLNGSTPGAPRLVYQAPIAPVGNLGDGSDDFDVINGYVDASGGAHLVANVMNRNVPHVNNRIHLIEGGKQTPAIEIPGPVGDTWYYPPTLLLDAQGRQHIIALYRQGEQPSIRDYVVGSDREPVVIRAAHELTGTLSGFEACQGPGGRMIALMSMNDTGKENDSEWYVSTSSGGAWSAPVNITNNSGRQAFFSRTTGPRSQVVGAAYWFPGDDAVAAFDKSGHLIISYISKRHGIFGGGAFGVTTFGDTTITPNLLFLRF